jgi:hypothetical protein
MEGERVMERWKGRERMEDGDFVRLLTQGEVKGRIEGKRERERQRERERG